MMQFLLCFTGGSDMIRHTVPESVAAMPLEKYVRRAWPMLPNHALRDLMKKRDVKREGQRLNADALVSGGDELVLYLPDKYNPAPAELSFEDEHLLAAVKPHGLPVDVDQDGVGADTLLTRLRAVHPSAQLCHRLDAATGGLVLAALDDETCAQALDVFREHALRKKYVALVKGGFPKKEGTLKAWLVKDAKRATVRVVHREEKNSKPIETRYRVVDESAGIARVELEPVTGRTHQLRAHMADFGHPILGDDKYGDRVLNKRSPAGLCLWCESLTLGKNCPLENYRGKTFAAPLPAWWEDIRRNAK